MIAVVTIRLAADLGRAIHLSLLRVLRSLDRTMTASAAQRELSALPDFLLRDIGVPRSEIGYAARFRARIR